MAGFMRKVKELDMALAFTFFFQGLMSVFSKSGAISMKQVEPDLLRILVVDDEQAILDSYQQVLFPERNPLGSEPEMQALAAKLFGEKLQQPSEADI